MRTYTINGLVVSDEIRSVLVQARLRGQRAAAQVGAPLPGDCANCGGIGWITVGLTPVIDNEEQARNKRRQIGSWLWGERWFRTEVLHFPCPVCDPEGNAFAGLYALCGLSEAEREWRLSFFEGKPGKERALATARELAAHAPPSGMVLFFGGYGVGKTGLLKSLVAQFVLIGVSAAYLNTADFLTELRSTFQDNSARGEAEVMRRYASLDFLAVDEFDRGSDTAWARSALFSLLDKRYAARARLATALASNVAPDALGPEYAYLANRLLDGERVPVGGACLRGV